ncbi:MAG: hypothetical protein HQ507_08740 [Candidatus Marinimicrobia bacterium]|nr:hypothetical protein [Candidatus Neomarinimicrobiota bacterium]
MRSALRILINILIFAFSCVQADSVVKITLNSSEVIMGSRVEQLLDDTLCLFSFSDQLNEQRIAVNEIASIISLHEPIPVKYIFSSLSRSQKLEILNGLVDPSIMNDSSQRSQILKTSADRQLQITVLMGVLIVLIIAISLLLKFKQKPATQEGIPGVEEMAKTTFFWAAYHRKKIDDD